MGRDNFVINVTETDTVQRFPLGQEYTEPADFWDRNSDVTGVGGRAVNQGPRTWRYIQCAAANAAAQGTVHMRAAGGETFANCLLATTGIPSLRVVGVAQHVIAAGSYGWVLIRGMGAVLADAAVAADAIIVAENATAAGSVDDTALGAGLSVEAIGICTTATTAAGVTDAWINVLG